MPKVLGNLRLVNLTSAQRDALGAVEDGTIIYNTTLEKLEVYSNSQWTDAGGSLSGGLTFADVWAVNTLNNC